MTAHKEAERLVPRRVAAPAPEKKDIKKLTIEIVDEAALAAAYPQIMEEKVVTTTVPNRQLLRPIVKAMYNIGQQVPGVRAYYAHEEDQKSASAGTLETV